MSLMEEYIVEQYTIPVSKPVTYHMTGKFEALSEDWKHAALLLGDYELFVVTKGVLYLEYNNRQYNIKEGEMLLLPPVPEPNNRRRGYQSSDCAFYWMHFDHDNNTDNSDIIILPEYGRLLHPEKATILMKQLQDAVRNGAASHTLNYMTSAILCVVSDDMQQCMQDETTQTEATKQVHEDIIDYVRHNIHTKITVHQIAEHFGYNEKYISQMFCKSYGITLKKFILESKAEVASFFLTDTNLTIEEIATKLGYSDSHNFTRSYKNITGFSPTGYRNAFSKRLLNH